jgi:hypothetical protein
VAIAEGAHFRGSVDMQKKSQAAPSQSPRTSTSATASTTPPVVATAH